MNEKLPTATPQQTLALASEVIDYVERRQADLGVQQNTGQVLVAALRAATDPDHLGYLLGPRLG